MTLEELQERYPHGSRWKLPLAKLVYTVHGWHHPVDGRPLLWTPVFGFQVLGFPECDSLVRIPDPVPCPITEPVTLSACLDPAPERGATIWTSGWRSLGMTTRHDTPKVTLHPPGTFDTGDRLALPERHGIYTWGET